MKLRHSARTDVGKTRDHNEDSYGVGEDEQAERLGALLVVCDGMGGHAAGEVASQIGVETILAIYYGDSSDERPIALEQAFEQANEQIYAKGRGSMGTTGVAALIHHDALHIANVGDSRAYLIRNGEIRQVSRDHSFVSDQVAAGLITPDQARSSPHRNVITRALGYQSGVTVDMFRLPLQVGDVIVLSSDGLHGLVNDAEIAKLTVEEAPDDAVKRLIDLANERGGTDNITVVIARVDALDWYGETNAEPPLDVHERVTVEIPIAEDIPEAPIAAVEAPPPAATPAPTTEPKARPAAPERRRPPIERRLTLFGGLLAVILLVVLVGVILFAMAPDQALAPAADPTFAATPAPTAGSTPAAGTEVPTSGPTAAPASAGTPSAPTASTTAP
jgi:serine/threonine protein phosphatase PrpC